MAVAVARRQKAIITMKRLNASWQDVNSTLGFGLSHLEDLVRDKA